MSCGCRGFRSGEFSTALFERYARSEKALVAALAEMELRRIYDRRDIQEANRVEVPGGS